MQLRNILCGPIAKCKMAELLKVLIYGESLLLAGLRPSLGAYPNLQVCALDGPPMDERALDVMQPNVIVFEVGAIQPDFHYRLTEKLPELLLVGIEAGTNEVMVWSGRQLRTLSTGELVERIGSFTRL